MAIRDLWKKKDKYGAISHHNDKCNWWDHEDRIGWHQCNKKRAHKGDHRCRCGRIFPRGKNEAV